ncbi:MAG: hypothetical protein WC430_01925 [Patescibacteria group bacterium]
MLSPRAEQLITEYLNLPFPGVIGARCPYFNNTRSKQRAQLGVLIGKGNPRDIVEETQIIAAQYRAKEILSSTPEKIREFLINNNLGIECSGFVTRVLSAHFRETAGVNLIEKLFIVSPKHFLRWLITKLRPIENINVNVYTNDKNTEKIKWRDARAGDVIIFLGTNSRYNRNHIILITEKTDQTAKYVHARAWASEGKYGHGVCEGEIKNANPTGEILEQTWVEKNKIGSENETYLEAVQAKTVEIRRIKI